MGRTLPTQIQLLQQEEESWKLYRRALRVEDQHAFDRLWALARRQSPASSMAGRMFPMESYLMSMVIGLQREIDQLQAALQSKPNKADEARFARDDNQGVLRCAQDDMTPVAQNESADQE